MYGAGLQLLPVGRSARLTTVGDSLVAQSDTLIDDDIVLGLIDAGRR